MALNQKGSERTRTIFLGDKTNNNSTTATTALNSTAWIDMQNWGRAIVVIYRVKGTGNVTANSGVYASAASTGTSPTAVATLGATGAMTGMVTAARGTILAPGAGIAVFDVSTDQIANALAGGRYIGVRVRKKTRADKVCAFVTLMDPKNAKASNMPTGINNKTVTITAP